jgi:hypothetical protein
MVKKMAPPKKIDYQGRVQQFNRRWNIAPDENTEFKKFHNRILVAIDKTLGEYILQHPEIEQEFAFAIGSSQPPQTTTDARQLLSRSMGRSLQDDNVYKIIASTTNLQSLITAIQSLFWVLEENHCPSVNGFENSIKVAIDYSPGINLRIVRRDKGVTLYPAGAKLLDEAVVNDTLLWLNDYPIVAKHFEEALRIYQSKDVAKYRNLLDNLRFALEQILKSILRNKKSLENQKGLLLAWLNEHGVHQQIINMYDDLLARFSQYQNDAVKHGERWSPPEIEFVIYLTATFIRFLLQLSMASEADYWAAET